MPLKIKFTKPMFFSALPTKIGEVSSFHILIFIYLLYWFLQWCKQNCCLFFFSRHYLDYIPHTISPKKECASPFRDTCPRILFPFYIGFPNSSLYCHSGIIGCIYFCPFSAVFPPSSLSYTSPFFSLPCSPAG